MMQYEIELSTKHPSEANNNCENCYLKSIICLVKNKTLYNIPIKIKIFCYQNNIDIKYVAYIRFGMLLVRIDGQKLNILGNENSAMYSK